MFVFCCCIQSELEEEEEELYTMEEKEREWERNAHNARHSSRSRTGTFMDAAGGFIRTVSMSGKVWKPHRERHGLNYEISELC